MWLLVIDRPHYPEVQEYASELEAMLAGIIWLAEEHREDGHCEAKIYVAEALRSVACKTYY